MSYLKSKKKNGRVLTKKFKSKRLLEMYLCGKISYEYATRELAPEDGTLIEIHPYHFKTDSLPYYYAQSVVRGGFSFVLINTETGEITYDKPYITREKLAAGWFMAMNRSKLFARVVS